MHTSSQTRRQALKVLLAAPLAAAASPSAILKRDTSAALLGRLERMIPLFRRSDWTHGAARNSRMVAMARPVAVTVHHWGYPADDISPSLDSTRSRILGILEAHLSRGYGDLGYHFVVDPFGRAWEGRSLLHQGAHVSSHNRSNVGIMLLGNFQTEHPSAPQLGTMRKLVQAVRSSYTISPGRTYGHCDLASSECPGRWLYGHVRNLRQRETA